MAGADDFLAGYPGSGGGSSSAPPGGGNGSFLGVPDNYSTPPSLADWFQPGGMLTSNPGGPGTIVAGPPVHTPTYRTGDETKRLMSLSVENLARLQGQLASVGLIGPSTRFRVGVVDSATVSAYKSLLSVANRYTVTDTEALNMLAQSGGVKGSDVTVDAQGNLVSAAQGPHTETTRSKNITEAVHTDPATARATLRNVWQQTFGRDPDEAEMRRYAKRLRAAEAGADVTTSTTRTHYDAQGSATSSTTHTSRQDDDTDPSAEVVADQMSRTGKLGRERNTRMAAVDYMGAILSLPGMNPGG